MRNKGTDINHVIAYLEKCKAKGYTHVAVAWAVKDIFRMEKRND